MMYLRRKLILANVMCCCNDATKLDCQEVYTAIQIYKLKRNSIQLMHMDDIKIFAKHEKEIETRIQTITLRYRNGIWF